MAETKATTMFSLATLKDYLKATGTNHDNTIVRIGDSVGERIESYIKRPVVTRAMDTEYPLPGSIRASRVRLLYFPIVSLTDASYRFTLLDQWVALNVATEIDVDAFRGYIYLKQLEWPVGPQLVKVNYQAGFGAKDSTAIPADIMGAGLDFAKWCYDRWKADTITTTSLTVGGAGSAVLVPSLPKDIKEALDGYAPIRI